MSKYRVQLNPDGFIDIEGEPKLEFGDGELAFYKEGSDIEVAYFKPDCWRHFYLIEAESKPDEPGYIHRLVASHLLGYAATKKKTRRRGELPVDRSARKSVIESDCKHFIRQICDLIDYWASDDVERKTVRYRLNGLAFSILAEIDGSGNYPPFQLIPYHYSTDGNMYIYEGVDISGDLRHTFFEMRRE